MSRTTVKFSGEQIVKLFRQSDLVNLDCVPSLLYLQVMPDEVLDKIDAMELERRTTVMDTIPFRDFIFTNNPYIREIIEKGKISFDDEYYLTSCSLGDLYITSNGILNIHYYKSKIIRKRKGSLELNIGERLEEYLSSVAAYLNGKVENAIVKIIRPYQILPFMSNYTVRINPEKTFEYGEGATLFPTKLVITESQIGNCDQAEVILFSFKKSYIEAKCRQFFNHCNYENDIMNPFIGIGDYLPSYASYLIREKYRRYWSFLAEVIDAVSDTISVLFGRDFNVLIKPFGDFCFPEIDELFDERHTLKGLKESLERDFRIIINGQEEIEI